MRESAIASAGGLRERVLKGGTILVASKGLAQACSFVRNIIVARAIGAENFGIAATFSITMSIIELLGSFSIDKLIIQAPDGESEELQAAAQAMRSARGFAGALLLAAFAWPLAEIFHIPQATWAFRYLAIVPALRGLAHLDPQRVQRQLDYRSIAALEVAQQLVPLMVAWPLAHVIGNYSVMVWLLLLQGAVELVGTFAVSRRPYRWLWKAEYTKRFFEFGWPLIINNFLIFLVFQGDRSLIATQWMFERHRFTMADLGAYSVATSLTLTPVIAFSNVSSALLLPIFSSLRLNPAALRSQYRLVSEIVVAASGFFALPLVISGGWIISIIYGKTYQEAGTVVGWLAAAQAIRMARFAPVATAMAHADNNTALISNLVRSSFLILSALFVFLGLDMQWIAASACFGELAGSIACLVRLDRLYKISMLDGFRNILYLVLIMGLTGVLARLFPSARIIWNVVLLLVSLSVFLATMLLCLPRLRAAILSRRLLPVLDETPSCPNPSSE